LHPANDTYFKPPSYFPYTNGYFPLNKAARLFVGAGSQGGSGNNLCPRITRGIHGNSALLVVLNAIILFVPNRNHIYDIQELIDRNIEAFVTDNLSVFPAVAILGPRQCGKSTLVKMLYQNLDDLNKLREPTLFFQA
jgi:hypothetical protein